jgi:glycosyltransferase involved in cell wall biosynthesis
VKIVLSTKHFLPTLGGSINYAAILACALQRKGADVILVTRECGSPESINAVKIEKRPSIIRLLSIAAWADLIIQVDASWRDALPFLLLGKPWFPTIHSGRISKGASLRTKAAQCFLSLAYKLGNTITVSDQVSGDWKISSKAINNPYDENVFYQPHLKQDRTIDLLFVGRIEESKGVFVLMEALQKIPKSLNKTIHCSFVGEGSAGRQLQQQIASFGEGVEFTYCGHMIPEKVAEQMRKSKILVFPTTPDWIEASPLTPLEALACGCRVIASDSGGTRDNIGPDGILVPSGDVESLANSILQLLDSPPDRDFESIAAFLSKRSSDAVADLYLERFRACLN